VNAKINSAKARSRADELKEERTLTPSPPIVTGGAMIIPMGLLWKVEGKTQAPALFARDTKRV